MNHWYVLEDDLDSDLGRDQRDEALDDWGVHREVTTIYMLDSDTSSFAIRLLAEVSALSWDEAAAERYAQVRFNR